MLLRDGTELINDWVVFNVTLYKNDWHSIRLHIVQARLACHSCLL